MIKEREYSMDFLRVLACFMVVVLHVSAQNWGTVHFTSPEWQAFNLYDAMVRSAVPLFFMISGKLFLSKETLSMKTLFLKNILRLVLVYILWSFLYALDTMGIANIMNGFRLSEFVSIVIASKYHLWYLPELISVYLMLPILFALKRYQDGKMLNYACIMIFLFTILRASVLVFVENELLVTLLKKVNFGWGSCCGYFILGYALDRNKEIIKKVRSSLLLILLIVLILVTTVGVYLDSVAKGMASLDLYNDIFITNYLEAVIIFLLFLRLPTAKLSKCAKNCGQKMSKYTLFVYLVHPFVIEHLPVNTLSFTPWLSVPVISVAVFAVAMCAAWAIDKMPWARKVLL